MRLNAALTLAMLPAAFAKPRLRIQIRERKSPLSMEAQSRRRDRHSCRYPRWSVPKPTKSFIP
jgi:hypothetical protein